jgi:hypothetical protein
MNKIRHDDDLFDSNGILRDGARLRVPMQARDAARMTERQRHRQVEDTLRSVNTRGRITDGRTDDPTALNRPGFRVPEIQDRRGVLDARQQYQTQIQNRYKCGDGEMLCPDCEGEGYINGDLCKTCNGDGVIDDDSTPKDEGGGYDSHNHSLDQQRQVRDQQYLDYDSEIASAWRGTKG